MAEATAGAGAGRGAPDGMGLPARLLRAPLAGLAAKRGALLVWAPVCLGAGIGGYFLLRTEPGALAAVAAGAMLAAALGLRRVGGELGWAPANAAALVAGGFLLMMLRAHLVAAPVLAYRYYGPVEGRIVEIDRSFSDALRITLDRVVLGDIEARATPQRVRIALHGEGAGTPLAPGKTVMLSANLAPPDGPVSPGGFDFQRLAWFSRLGAVGYSRTPVVAVAPPDPGDWRLLAFRLRMALSAQMRAGMGGGQAAALSAAFMTGDRSAIDAATNEAMRASNLSHLISISGLHMGLITGFVFAALRFGIALVPPLALRIDARKIAALVAALAATFYLALAGPDVATRRAYVMALVMMLAVLADRRALTLRSVAISALIVLAFEPESVIEPGFQMSFSATVALIWAAGATAGWQGRVPRWLRPATMAVVASLAAGLATAPVAAAHFNRIAEYGLIANLLVTPVMGLVVMPAGALALLSMPFGLAGPVLWAMRLGTEAVLAIAGWVAGWEGAVVTVPTPAPAVLPLGMVGLMVAGLGPGRGVRIGAGALAAAAFLIWATDARPPVLVASDGGLVGVVTQAGRALSKPKGGGFVARSWLEDDGDAATQEEAAARPGFSGPKGERRMTVAGRSVIHLTGKTAAERMPPLCRDGALIVLAADWPAGPPGDCDVLDRTRLRATGAVAFFPLPEGWIRVTAREVAGTRLWNARPQRRAGQ